MSQGGSDVLFALGSEHEPRICHREQRTLRFEIIEVLDKLKTFLGVSPIALYQLRHASGPQRFKDAFLHQRD
jgi:hypothetical protein